MTSEPFPRTIEWIGGLDGFVRIIDQTRLPTEFVYRDCHTVEEMWEAIRVLRVRGAPAIGIAGAMGVLLELNPFRGENPGQVAQRVRAAANRLATSRPTAVNLFWALKRMEQCLETALKKNLSSDQILNCLLVEAQDMVEEDQRVCHALGAHGAQLIKDDDGILTHCNAGALVTVNYGTALAVMYKAAEQGKRFKVYANETRPLLQGARLTTWELQRHGLDVTLICDSMTGQVMKEGRIQLVIVGADRIAANGDTANKIGTYSVAVLAKAHSIPFYVAAPRSTFDLTLASGDKIPIEQRDSREVTHGFGKQTAPDGIKVYNPAFDVTPAHLIAGLITEAGVISPVTTETILATIGPSS
jgi:methylthioribose-1-phosphate isomerase